MAIHNQEQERRLTKNKRSLESAFGNRAGITDEELINVAMGSIGPLGSANSLMALGAVAKNVGKKVGKKALENYTNKVIPYASGKFGAYIARGRKNLGTFNTAKEAAEAIKNYVPDKVIQARKTAETIARWAETAKSRDDIKEIIKAERAEKGLKRRYVHKK